MFQLGFAPAAAISQSTPKSFSLQKRCAAHGTLGTSGVLGAHDTCGSTRQHTA